MESGSELFSLLHSLSASAHTHTQPVQADQSDVPERSPSALSPISGLVFERFHFPQNRAEGAGDGGTARSFPREVCEETEVMTPNNYAIGADRIHSVRAGARNVHRPKCLCLCVFSPAVGAWRLSHRPRGFDGANDVWLEF